MKVKTYNIFIKHLDGVLNSKLSVDKYIDTVLAKEVKNANLGWYTAQFNSLTDEVQKPNSFVSLADYENTTNKMKKLGSLHNKRKPSFEKADIIIASTDITELVTEHEGDVEYERGEDGKIQYYMFKVYIQGKEPLVGKLSRDEMNMIHRLYSYYGQSITQREVSRYFPEYSLVDFKRILKVFNITKASSPFAPHVIEEHSTEELAQMNIREKENDFLRRLEIQRVKDNEKLLQKYALENAELKDTISKGKHLLDGLFNNYKPAEIPVLHTNDCSKDLIIWLSDMHTGAAVSDKSIYINPYDEEEMNNRLHRVFNAVRNTTYNDIIVCNLGDSLDGMDAQTTRRDHRLPQNMGNKEQLHAFIRVMTKFMSSIRSYIPHNNTKYYCVGESNHDGDFGYAANIALEAILTPMGVECRIFDKFIGHFTLGDQTFILCHGKDNKDMFKNLPLTLNEKTENFINEYLDFHALTGDITFVKGDLHQSATTYGRRFKYKSVGSLFGSSEWIHKNFGNTLAACDFTIIDNGLMFDSRIVVQ